jgi:hypothetical protein
MPSKTQVKTIVKRRQQGYYITEETKNEVRLALAQMAPTDQVITLIRKQGVFNQYDKREWLLQVADWRRLKAQCLRCNIRRIADDVGVGEAWLMVIQPEGGMDGFCPLAAAMGVLVSGFTYIAKDKAPFELAWAALGRKE